MTAEIAVMNRDAVALAADSAVTVMGKKSYHTTNKIFSLGPNQPIGIMVYGNADLAGVPWETIIKLFRKKYESYSFSSVSDCGMEFFKYISFFSNFFSPNNGIEDLEYYAETYCEKIIEDINVLVEEEIDKSGKINRSQVSSIKNNAIKSSFDNLISQNPVDKVLFSSDLDIFYSGFVRSNFLDLIKEKFDGHGLSKKNIDLIMESIEIIFRNNISSSSGVVFAGFGEAEVFPSLCHYGVEGVFGEAVKYALHVQRDLSSEDGNGAVIIPFADKRVVKAYIEGISEDMENLYLDTLWSSLAQLEVLWVETLEKSGMSSPDVEKIRDRVREVAMPDFSTIPKEVSTKKHEMHVSPLVQAIAYLPKSEMAEVAESLVSITSIRQKFSLSQETVGGAVDVAVISKCDGFIWVKRKFYFDSKLNPLYMSRYKGGV